MAKLLSGTRIYGTATVDTQLFVSGSNAASSTITGALQVVGGVGVGGNLYVGGTIYGTINGTITTATNISAGTAGQLVYQSNTGTTAFAGPGTAGQILLSSGTNAPVYTSTSSVYVGRAALADTATLANNATTATNIAGGTAGQLHYQSNTGTTAFAGPGTAGQILLSSGTNAPVYTSTASIYVGKAVLADSATTALTATTATNIAAGTAGQVPYQSNTGNTSFYGPGTAGQILLSSGTSAPVYTNTASIYVGRSVLADLATTATTATNIAAGTAGQVPYQSNTGNTSFYGPGTAGQILLSSGTSAPVYTNTASIYVGRAALADSATTALTATTATNLSGGATGSLPYQTGGGSTTMLAIGTTGYVLSSNGTTPQWSSLASFGAGSATTATNVVIANETATSTVQYLTFISVSTGSSILKVAATTGLTYLPNSGYVGMGIATPTAPLHLVSSANSILKFQGGTTGSVGVLYSDATQLRFGDSSGSNGFTALTVSSEATIKTNATEAVRVDSSQQVGINTTRPNYRLDVRGQTYIGTAPTLPQLILGDTTNSTTSTITTNNGDLIFSANGTAEAVRITSSKGIAFGGSTNYGTSGQLLKSAGNASPTWVDQNTIAAGSVANSHTAGTGLSGSTYNGSAAVTWTLNTATLMTTAVTANNLAATATLGGSGYLYIGGYNTNPSSVIYPTPFTVNSTGPIAIADNFSGGGVEANIWNTVYPSSYASTGFRFQQLLTTNTYRDLVFFKNTGAIAFGGLTNYGTSGQLLQSNGDAAPTWVGLNAVTVGKATTATNLAGGTSGQIPYQTGPDTTSFMTNANWNSSTNILSVTGTVQSTVFSRTGAINASSWTTTSPTFSSAANAFNDTSSAASATVSARVAISFLDPSFTANNAGVVITDAVNLYVKAPVAGTNVSFTNNWGIWNQGASFVGSSEKVTTSLAVGSYAITANAGDILASGNGMFGYSTAQSGARLSVSGAGYINGILTATSVITTQGLTDVSGTNAALRVVSPGGASSWQGSSSVTGAIKIKLPTGITLANTMLRFTVKVYTYDGQSFDINCGGYTYTTAPGNWINTFAFMHTQSRAALAVRFGYDASTANYCVYIGELTTAWAYCNVFVTDFQAGYSNYAANQWNSGWAISWEASAFANVSATQTAYPWSSTAYSLTAGTGLSGSAFNGTGNVTWTNSGVTSNVAGTGIGVSAATGAVTITNTGVTSNVAGTGISVSGATGAVTITNSGVTSIVAGTNISVSGATGAVTVNVSGTVGSSTNAANVYQTTDPASTTYRILLGNGTNANAPVYNYSALYWNNGTATIQGANISGNAGSASTLANFTAATSGNPLAADSPNTIDDIGYVASNISLYAGGSAGTQTDGGLYVAGYSTSWYHQIYGDFRTGSISVRGKNSGTWQPWRSIPTIAISDTAPTIYNNGDLWWQSSTGRMKVRYSGASANQWVDVVPVIDTSLFFSKSGGAISGPVSINGALDVTGNITATAEITAYYSDRRLKTDVLTIENALVKVKKLNGVTYRPNALAESYGLGTNSDVVGLFADEVEQVLPQAVKPAPFDIDENGVSKSGENYKTIQYEKVVPLLVEAIKEQQSIIEAQQAKIDRLMKHLGLED